MLDVKNIHNLTILRRCYLRKVNWLAKVSLKLFSLQLVLILIGNVILYHYIDYNFLLQPKTFTYLVNVSNN